MWIAVVVVVLVIAMMVGPIMLMQPNKRQRRVAQLRAMALKCDLRVRMMRMPADAVRPGETVALYYKAWPGGKPRPVNWVLTRRTFVHGMHFLADWDWNNGDVASPAWQQILRQSLPQLPPSVIAVEASSQSLGLGWLEVAGGKGVEQAVEELNRWLQQVMDQFASSMAVPPIPDQDGDHAERD